MLAEFENVFQVENVQMGWRAPKPDAGVGGDDRTDVYIKNVGPDGLLPVDFQVLEFGRRQYEQDCVDEEHVKRVLRPATRAAPRNGARRRGGATHDGLTHASAPDS